MSYAAIITALHELFANIGEGEGEDFEPSLKAIVLGEPTSVQDAPMLYSEIEGFAREYGGTAVKITYRTVHRVCVRWQDNPEAELEMIGFVNSIPAAVDARPKLGGAANDASVVEGESGWVTIDGVTYRYLDLISEAVELVPLGAG